MEDTASSQAESGLVMIVDDTPENLSLLRQILSRAKMETLALPDGRMALDACAKRKPDLMLLDVNMPGLNGYEVCGRLKADPRFCDIPVLFLSALSSSSDKLKAFDAGGVDYITKPFQQEEVIARVRTHLRLNRLSGDLAVKNRELALANRNLAELEDARDMLVQTIVHDMRSLLMAVTGYLDLISSMDAGEFEKFGAEDASKALATATLLSEMTSQVLDVSKIESDALDLSIETFDLVALGMEVASRLQILKGGRIIEQKAADGPVMVNADRELIGRVILNLLSNSIKFTNSKIGRITFGASRTGRGACFFVTDNGPGIPPELREKVFDKYWQGKERLEGHKFGSGLGLTFCRMAVERHGGAISVSSGEDGGSRFEFFLE